LEAPLHGQRLAIGAIVDRTMAADEPMRESRAETSSAKQKGLIS
jgi:hypothetical protein